MAGAGAVGVATISFDSWISKANAQPVRMRFDAMSDEGKEMLELYAIAVGAMRDKSKYPETDPMGWEWQFYTHWIPGSRKDQEIDRIFGAGSSAEKMLAIAMWETCRGHSGGSVDWRSEKQWFLPWHRMYVFYFETIVREVVRRETGREDFTLPYWDYTTAGKNFVPEEFRQPTDALYKSLYISNRNAAANSGSLFDCGDNASLAEANYAPGTASGGFNNTLDNGTHGTVHVQVGDLMNMGRIPFAANDPIFWLHHCNIDRFWASWNRAGRQNPTNSAWQDKTFTFFDGKTQIDTPTSAVTDIANMQYDYSTFLPVPPIPQGVNAMAFLAAPQGGNAAADEEALSLVQGLSLESGVTNLRAQLPDPLLMGDAAGQEQRLYLVLNDLTTDEQPGTIYNVYLGGIETAEGQDDTRLVGSINFFDAPLSGAETEGRGHAYSFDVTELVSELQAAGEIVNAPEVSIAPLGAPVEDATPFVGEVFFAFE
ncbi:MAG: tyrosinase family protein [Pseudomonadota bacterium]